MKKRKKRSTCARHRMREHRLSILMISGVIAILAIMLSVSSISLHAKNQKYKEQEAELTSQIEEQAIYAEEIEEFEEYAYSDEYIEDVAKEKLGMAYPNEILFKPE